MSLITMLIMGTAAESAPITFDDAGSAGDGIVVPPGYAGLVWENFRILDVQQELLTYGANGYTNGVKSGNNIGFNFLGAPAAIKTTTGFDVSTLYATAAWNQGLQLNITAKRDGTTVFSNDYTLSTASALPILLNLTNITSLQFAATGGTPAGFGGSGSHFAIDDINVVLRSTSGSGAGEPVNNVPIPAALPLFIAGIGGMSALARRRKRT